MVIAFKVVLIKEVLKSKMKKIIWRFESQLCFKKLTFLFLVLKFLYIIHIPL